MTINKIAKMMLAAAVVSTTTASAFTIDVMYAYTPAVKNSYGSSSSTLIKLRVKERLNNSVFQQTVSDTTVDLNRVALFETDYNTTDDADRQLARMMESVVKMPEVLAKRAEVSADLVQLYCVFEENGKGELFLNSSERGDWGSVVDGYLLGTYSNPFNFVATNSLAHNFNAIHSKGFEVSDGRYTNVFVGDDSVERLPCFSSKNRYYNGMVLGDSSHDNRVTIRNYSNTVRKFN